MKTSVRRITASSQTTSGMTWTTTSSSPSTTPMTTLTHCTCTSTDAWRTCTETARASLFHSLMMTPHTSWLKFWAHSHCHPRSQSWAHLLDSTSPFLLLPLPPVCHRLPLPPRAVPWAPLHDRHGKPALLRCRREWGHLNSFTSNTRCIWSAKRTRILLKWILWRSRVVLR